MSPREAVREVKEVREVMPGRGSRCRIVSRWKCPLVTTLPFIITPVTLCGVDEAGKPAKDLVERVGGMGRPSGQDQKCHFSKGPRFGLF